MLKSIKPVETALGTTYGLCKVHIQEIEGWLPHLGQFYWLYSLPQITLLNFQFPY